MIDGQRVRAYAATHKTGSETVQHQHVALLGREVAHYRLAKPAQSAPARNRSAGGAGLTAQMPGQVVQVLVAESDHVEAGQPLLLLEAMKMETQVTAPHAGTVARLMVQQGDTVERGQQLAEIKPLDA